MAAIPTSSNTSRRWYNKNGTNSIKLGVEDPLTLSDICLDHVICLSVHNVSCSSLDLYVLVTQFLPFFFGCFVACFLYSFIYCYPHLATSSFLFRRFLFSPTLLIFTSATHTTNDVFPTHFGSIRFISQLDMFTHFRYQSLISMITLLLPLLATIL